MNQCIESSGENDIDDCESQSSGEFFVSAQSNSGEGPHFRPTVWAISSRPVSNMRKFSALTLMFQPDIRLFCSNGDRCGVLNEDHWRMYCHRLPEKQQSKTSTENPHGVYGIKQTWELKGDIFESSAMSDELPRNSKVVFFVHGHRTRYFKFTATLNHLDSICNPVQHSTEDEPHTSSVHVVGFLWPCHCKKLSYGLARSNASSEGAQRLRRCITALQMRGNDLVLVGHSLGARLTLSALSFEHNSYNASCGGVPHPVRHVLLLGAAVHADALTSEFSREHILASHISNFHTSRDDVLADGFGWAEMLSLSRFSLFGFPRPSAGAMGGAGGILKLTAGADHLPRGCENVDVTTEVGTHSVHAYLASPTFRQYLLGILMSTVL